MQVDNVKEEELKFKAFILKNMDMFDSIDNKEQKAEQIVDAIRFYFTSVYNSEVEDIKEITPPAYEDPEEAKKSQT